MFIRSSSQKDPKTRRVYTTYRLVQGYRNSAGKVRQETLLNLGSHFSIPQTDWKLLTDRIEELLSSQSSLFSIEITLEKEAQRLVKLIRHKYAKIQDRSLKQAPQSQQESDYQSVDVNSLSHETIRYVGAEHVAYQTVLKLELDKLLGDIGLNKKQINLALGTIIGRLISPGSELSTHRYLKEQSALDELMGTDFSALSLKNFYIIADELLKRQDKIESALYQREKSLFNLNEVVTLYDITNTYFEGRALGNKKACHGRSKEKRHDCPLVSMGLVLDASGFPKKSKLFPGNISEPHTIEAMLGALNAEPHATIVMDAGFSTEANIEWLKAHGYAYIVVSRKKSQCMPEDADPVVVKDVKNNIVTAKRVYHEDTNEVELYCHSQAKEEKSQWMHSKLESRFESELQKIVEGLSKKTGMKKQDKINQRVGRLKEKYKRVAKYYSITIIADNTSGKVTSMTWKKETASDQSLGMYCLRTNQCNFDEKTLWSIYTMLTDVESAFRSMKTELGFRPVYHQKEHRVDAHLFISVLAYHVLHTIRFQLKQAGLSYSWHSIRHILSTQVRLTSTLLLEDGRKLSIRKTARPTPDQIAIYKALNINASPGKTEKAYF